MATMAKAAGHEDLSDVWMTANKYGFTTSLTRVCIGRPYDGIHFKAVEDRMVTDFSTWLDDPSRPGYYDIPEGFSNNDNMVWIEVFLTDPNTAVELKIRFR